MFVSSSPGYDSDPDPCGTRNWCANIIATARGVLQMVYPRRTPIDEQYIIKATKTSRWCKQVVKALDMGSRG